MNTLCSYTRTHYVFFWRRKRKKKKQKHIYVYIYKKMRAKRETQVHYTLYLIETYLTAAWCLFRPNQTAQTRRPWWKNKPEKHYNCQTLLMLLFLFRSPCRFGVLLSLVCCRSPTDNVFCLLTTAVLLFVVMPQWQVPAHPQQCVSPLPFLQTLSL